MRSLLDVNLVIALLDSNHVLHQNAHEWWEANSHTGWSSCPLTENGVIRILSHPNYSQEIRLTPEEMVGRLSEFVKHTNHEFWPDDISLRDASKFAIDHVLGPKQLTDIYLLGLALEHKAKLVTFDRGFSMSAVKGASDENLFVIK